MQLDFRPKIAVQNQILREKQENGRFSTQTPDFLA